MKMNPNFEIVNITDDYMAVPVGEKMASFGGTVLLNEVSAFLLKNMKQSITREELFNRLLKEYDVSDEQAASDFETTISKFIKLGLIEE